MNFFKRLSFGKFRSLYMFIVLLIAASLLSGKTAFAGTPPIPQLPTLYNTGVNSSHDLVSDGAADANYSG